MKLILAAILALTVAAPASAHNSPCPGRQRVFATLTAGAPIVYQRKRASVDYVVAQWEGGQLVLIFNSSTPTTRTLIVNGVSYPDPAGGDTYQDFAAATFCA